MKNNVAWNFKAVIQSVLNSMISLMPKDSWQRKNTSNDIL